MSTSASRSGRSRTEFGEWLNGQMQDRGWSIGDLSRQTGKSTSIISNWLYRHAPNLGNCIVLAETLNIPLDDVLEATFLGRPATDRLRLTIHRAIDAMDETELSELAVWLQERT